MRAQALPRQPNHGAGAPVDTHSDSAGLETVASGSELPTFTHSACWFDP